MITFDIDTRDFNRQIEEYYKVSKSASEDILIRRAFFVALKAMKGTPITPRETIRAELSKVVEARRLHPPGKSGQAPRAAALVQSKRAVSKKPGFYGIAMADAVRALIKRRMASRGYFKAGWLPALMDLGASFEKGQQYWRQMGKRKISGIVRASILMRAHKRTEFGYARIDRGTDRTSVELANNVALRKEKDSRRRGEAHKALQDAVNAETAEMGREIERRLTALAERSGRLGMKAVAA